MTPTTVSIRLAIKKIAEITCGVRPKAVPVAIAVDSTDPVFVVSIPFEYKVEVYSYLAEHLGFGHPMNGKPLTLTRAEASAIVELVLKQTGIAQRSIPNSSDEHDVNFSEEPLLDTPQAQSIEAITSA